MADTKSDLVLAGVRPDMLSPAGITLSQVATYTVPAGGSPGIGDLCEMVPVAKGAKILEVTIASSDTTASLTLDVGDATTVDKYLDAVDGSAAFIASLTGAGDAANDGVGYEYTAADTIDITFNVAAPTAGNIYTMTVTYVM